MKIAVIGSRSLQIPEIEPYLPQQTTEIVSGGAAGIDRCAAQCARRNGWKLKEFLPDYRCYGRAAPLIRNRPVSLFTPVSDPPRRTRRTGFSRGLP